MTTVQKLSSPSRAAWDAFRVRVSELGGVVLEVEWLGKDAPHRTRCAAGHERTPRPSSVARGQHFCAFCGGHGSRIPEAEFRARLDELGATLLEAQWRGNRTPHRVRCAAGHECTPQPAAVRRGQGICRRCVRRDPGEAWTSFRARIEARGGEVLEPKWLGSRTPHRVRCVNGHVNHPRPDNVQRWGICRTCAGNDTTVAEAAFRARLVELGATLLEPTWLGGKVPHKARCAKGHACKPRPHSVLQGDGICRLCAGKVWDVFYVVTDEINDVVKFGITSGDPRSRLSRHAGDGFDCVLRLITGLPNDLAPRLERAVLAALRDAREAPVRGREYFPARVLGLVLDVVDGWTGAASTVSQSGQRAIDIAA